MGTLDMILAVASVPGAAGVIGVAWNLRNAWKESVREAEARERRHMETIHELKQTHAVQSAILSALVERMDRADIRTDRIESRLEALMARKD